MSAHFPMIVEEDNTTATALRYFPALYRGTFASEASAIAAAGFPHGTVQIGAPIAMAHAASMLVFHVPASDTAFGNCCFVILSPAGPQSLEMWFADHDLANATIEQAMQDIQRLGISDSGSGVGAFHIFEVLQD